VGIVGSQFRGKVDYRVLYKIMGMEEYVRIFKIQNIKCISKSKEDIRHFTTKKFPASKLCENE
jgi:hypothetical protein